jgi:uncharacterized protein
MKMKKALIVYGGWDGHEPVPVSKVCQAALLRNDFEVEMSDTLDVFCDGEKLKKLDLIVPIWTMGSIKREQLGPVLEAVKSGVGIAGCHGGMGDAFRQETEWQFMTGGQWVAHPGNDGRLYTVEVVDQNPITAGLKDFEVRSEKYYMHVDPAIRVMAVTKFEDYGDAIMPVTWTKTYGQGRVFYTSLGHHADILEMPPALQMMERGMLWAAGQWQLEMGAPFAKAYCG